MKHLVFIMILSSSITQHMIFDFNKEANIQNWFIINDGVMGGRSAASIRLNEDGHGVFEGYVSLENNGGFTSVRCRFNKLLVSDFTKICLKLKGDGKQYQLRIKSDASESYSYAAPFVTTTEWQEIEIPLKEMYPTFRGRKLARPNFSKEAIEEITFLIGNKKEEDFILLLDSIELR